MPQLPRQFAQSGPSVRAPTSVPQAPTGQGLAALGQGLSTFAVGIAALEQSYQDSGVLEAVQRYEREAIKFKAGLQTADDFKNFGSDAIDALAAIQDQYKAFVKEEYGDQGLSDFLRRTEATNKQLNASIANQGAELGQNAILAKVQTNLELAVERKDGEALREAIQPLVGAAWVDPVAVQKLWRDSVNKLNVQHLREKALTDPMTVLNAIATDAIPEDVPQDMIDELANKARTTLQFEQAQGDREERKDRLMRAEATKGYKLAVHKKFAEIMRLKPEQQLAALEAMEDSVAEEAARTIEVETGIITTFVEEDVVATMRTDRDALRGRIIRGETGTSLHAESRYLSQITDFLELDEANALMRTIENDDSLGFQPKAELIDRVVKNINSTLAREIKLGVGRVNNRLKATGFGAQLVPDNQAIASAAENEFIQSAYRHEEELRAGTKTFEDISQPIIKKYQGVVRQSFYNGAQTIRPYVETMINQFLIKQKAGYDFTVPQDMIAHEMQRPGADMPALIAAKNMMDTMEAVNPEDWANAIGRTVVEPAESETAPKAAPPSDNQRRERLKNLFNESVTHQADQLFAASLGGF